MSTQAVYTAAQSRSLDVAAAKSLNLSGFALMQRAGAAALAVLEENFSTFSEICVLCGKGNNGGDGYILAALAQKQGLSTQVFELADITTIAGDARKARDLAVKEGVVCVSSADLLTISQDVVIVDAILGTGFKGELSAETLRVLNLVCASQAHVLAMDIPTGINADTGGACAGALFADLTVTFIGLKRGLVTGAGKKHCGTLVLRDLGVSTKLSAGASSAALFEFDQTQLPVRRADGHKGSFGNLVIVGGDINMGGAVILAAQSALRAGCGLVTVVTRGEHRCGMQAHRPEVMLCAASDHKAVTTAINKADCVLVGPGMGTQAWGQELLQQCLAFRGPKVLDADALNLVSSGASSRLENCVITPHPGEAGRLLGLSTAQIQADRFVAVAQLADQYGAVVVLKGPGTLVCGQEVCGQEVCEQEVCRQEAFQNVVGICQHGNAGMATAGMGDVLAGILASFVAQGVTLEAAARLGVALHSASADIAVQHTGERSLLASDVIEAMISLLAGA